MKIVIIIPFHWNFLGVQWFCKVYLVKKPSSSTTNKSIWLYLALQVVLCDVSRNHVLSSPVWGRYNYVNIKWNLQFCVWRYGSVHTGSIYSSKIILGKKDKISAGVFVKLRGKTKGHAYTTLEWKCWIPLGPCYYWFPHSF